MGVVYKSFDPVIRRPVALKMIRKEILSDEEEASAFGARFRNEAQAAGRLSHPGIVTVYEYGEDAQYAFIAMEYVEGNSLRQYFERKVRFEPRDLVSVMVQLLEVLQFAHDKGVWHRDIKPANIMIMRSGRIKVADFGIARIDSSTLTQVGAVMGTPGYIAPEQYLGKDVDNRVDIFAAGAVFYEMLTGGPPFSGSRESVMYKVCHETVPLPSVVAGKSALARFDAIALRALARRPEDRYASADRFRAELLAAYDQPVSPTVSQETLVIDAGRAIDSGEGSTPRSGAPKSSGAAVGSSPALGASGSNRGPQVATVPTEVLAAAGWNLEELAAVERSLARYLGPIARILVRNAARQAKDFASLIKSLAELLTLPADRTEFVRHNSRRTASASSPARIEDNDATVVPGASTVAAVVGPAPTAEEVAQAARLLAVYLGPIARVLVRKAAQPGVSRAVFLAGLTDRLSESEKENFLKDFERSS